LVQTAWTVFMAAEREAATAQLGSSAIRATFSPGLMLRQVSMAFFAPGSNSGEAGPKFMQIF
jgi:hypothetical protein